MVPFGLAQAPTYFQALISKVLNGLHVFAMAYLEDIIIFSRNEAEHLEHLKIIFQRLKEARLKLKQSKCDFIKKHIHKAGADVNKQNDSGLSPLIWTSWEGHEKCVDLLLKAGADMNMSDKLEYTGLMLAMRHGYGECYKLLLEAGADEYQQDNRGQTASMQFLLADEDIQRKFLDTINLLRSLWCCSDTMDPLGLFLGPSSLKNRFRALKPSAFERELNFKKSYAIFGDLSQATP